MFYVINRYSAEVISSHRDNGPARDAAKKLDRKAGNQPGDNFVHETDEKLKTGVKYQEVVDAHKQRLFDNAALILMCSILKDEEEPAHLAARLASLQLTLDELRSRYGEAAQVHLAKEAEKRQKLAEDKARRHAAHGDVVKERSEVTYTFPAVSGIQAGKIYYCAQIPYTALVRLFTFEAEYVPAEHRAQRVLNARRAAAIGEYITANPDDYVLPALTASVSAEMFFEPLPVPGAADRVGLLHIPIEATMLINDGQHRRAGIERAIASHPSLKNETIAVTLYFDQGLERSQQMFADINTQQVKPSSSINALYDHRNPFNTWAIDTIKSIPGLASKIDFENATVGAKSMKLWSLVGFKRFLQLLTGINEDNVEACTETDRQRQALANFVKSFLTACGQHIPSWGPMISGVIPAVSIRDNLVIGHQVWLEALAMFGRHALYAGQLMAPNPLEGPINPGRANWEFMAALAEVDPTKSSEQWQGRCVVLGRMQKTSDGVKSTAAQLVKLTNKPLPPTLAEVEQRIQQQAR